MSVKEDIITKFYDKHERTNTIAEELEIRPSYVTKIIQADGRYTVEKENRAMLYTEKRKAYKNSWIKNKRNEIRQLDGFVKFQHIQAVQELSHEVALTTDNGKCNRGNPNSIRSKYKYFGCRAV